MNQVAQTARVVMPGSRVAYDYAVERTQDGRLRFKSARTIGIYDPKKKQAYYCSRGNSNLHLRHQARKVVLTQDIITTLERAAVLSPAALKKLTG